MKIPFRYQNVSGPLYSYILLVPLDRILLFSPASYLTEVIETKQMLLVEQNLIPSEQLSYLVAGDFIWLLLFWNTRDLSSALWT